MSNASCGCALGACHASLHGGAEDAHPGAVLVESIRRFKGLERPVVILADLGSIDATELPAMMYVGVSRARAHLVAVATADTLRRLGL